MNRKIESQQKFLGFTRFEKVPNDGKIHLLWHMLKG